MSIPATASVPLVKVKYFMSWKKIEYLPEIFLEIDMN